MYMPFCDFSYFNHRTIRKQGESVIPWTWFNPLRIWKYGIIQLKKWEWNKNLLNKIHVKIDITSSNGLFFFEARGNKRPRRRRLFDTKDAFVKECPKLVECIKGEHSFACYFKTRFDPVVTEFIPQLSVLIFLKIRNLFYFFFMLLNRISIFKIKLHKLKHLKVF